jgi:hypothetical protein
MNLGKGFLAKPGPGEKRNGRNGQKVEMQGGQEMTVKKLVEGPRGAATGAVKPSQVMKKAGRVGVVPRFNEIKINPTPTHRQKN